jgi:hypothetical protein
MFTTTALLNAASRNPYISSILAKKLNLLLLLFLTYTYDHQSIIKKIFKLLDLNLYLEHIFSNIKKKEVTLNKVYSIRLMHQRSFLSYIRRRPIKSKVIFDENFYFS